MTFRNYRIQWAKLRSSVNVDHFASILFLLIKKKSDLAKMVISLNRKKKRGKKKRSSLNVLSLKTLLTTNAISFLINGLVLHF